MDTIIRQCDGCEKTIKLQNETDGIYHNLNLDFSTHITDPITGMVEEVLTMRRHTKTVYCQSCFEKFVNHMELFLKEVGPKYNKVSQVEVTGVPTKISEDSLKSIKAKENFKAKDGTVPAKTKEKKNVSKH